MSAPPTPKPPHLPLALLAATVLVLIVYRGYGPRFTARPTDHLPPAVAAVDLNAADKAELLQIPGVGPTLADAILTHREAAGRFDRVDDLSGVRGIGPKTLDKLRPWVRVSPGGEDQPTAALPAAGGPDLPVERLERKPTADRPSPPTPVAGAGKKLAAGETIDVNAASADELQRLPGIGPALAGRIVAERGKKPFSSPDDLRRVSGIGPKTLDRLRPHVVCR